MRRVPPRVRRVRTAREGAGTRFPLTMTVRGVSMEPRRPRSEAVTIHVVRAPSRAGRARRTPSDRSGGGGGLSGEDHPFFALASSWRAQRAEGTFDAKGRGEVAADVGLGDAEGGSGGRRAEGE